MANEFLTSLSYSVMELVLGFVTQTHVGKQVNPPHVSHWQSSAIDHSRLAQKQRSRLPAPKSDILVELATVSLHALKKSDCRKYILDIDELIHLMSTSS